MNIKKNLFGLILIPFCLGLVKGLLHELSSLKIIEGFELIFLAGFLSYVIIHIFLIRPRFLSTLAHEMTHIVWGLLFRAKIRDMRVKRGGGFVNLSKSNFIIRLSPYFFPLFTFIAVLLAFLVKPSYLPYVYFSIGFTLALHLSATLGSLKSRQPDIYKTGIVFAIPVVFILNLVILVLLLNFISPQNIHVMRFLKTSVVETFAILTSLTGV